jgi:hypothetical protein
MILQYRTYINTDKVRFLHHEDYRAPEIEKCFISWNCRIPLQEDGITKFYIDIDLVVLKYRRYLGNPNKNEEIFLSHKVETESWSKPRCRTRFIDSRPTPYIKPVEIFIGYSDIKEENIVNLIEFSK